MNGARKLASVLMMVALLLVAAAQGAMGAPTVLRSDDVGSSLGAVSGNAGRVYYIPDADAVSAKVAIALSMDVAVAAPVSFDLEPSTVSGVGNISRTKFDMPVSGVASFDFTIPITGKVASDLNIAIRSGDAEQVKFKATLSPITFLADTVSLDKIFTGETYGAGDMVVKMVPNVPGDSLSSMGYKDLAIYRGTTPLEADKDMWGATTQEMKAVPGVDGKSPTATVTSVGAVKTVRDETVFDLKAAAVSADEAGAANITVASRSGTVTLGSFMAMVKKPGLKFSRTSEQFDIGKDASSAKAIDVWADVPSNMDFKKMLVGVSDSGTGADTSYTTEGGLKISAAAVDSAKKTSKLTFSGTPTAKETLKLRVFGYKDADAKTLISSHDITLTVGGQLSVGLTFDPAGTVLLARGSFADRSIKVAAGSAKITGMTIGDAASTSSAADHKIFNAVRFEVKSADASISVTGTPNAPGATTFRIFAVTDSGTVYGDLRVEIEDYIVRMYIMEADTYSYKFLRGGRGERNGIFTFYNSSGERVSPKLEKIYFTGSAPGLEAVVDKDSLTYTIKGTPTTLGTYEYAYWATSESDEIFSSDPIEVGVYDKFIEVVPSRYIAASNTTVDFSMPLAAKPDTINLADGYAFSIRYADVPGISLDTSWKSVPATLGGVTFGVDAASGHVTAAGKATSAATRTFEVRATKNGDSMTALFTVNFAPMFEGNALDMDKVSVIDSSGNVSSFGNMTPGEEYTIKFPIPSDGAAKNFTVSVKRGAGERFLPRLFALAGRARGVRGEDGYDVTPNSLNVTFTPKESGTHEFVVYYEQSGKVSYQSKTLGLSGGGGTGSGGCSAGLAFAPILLALGAAILKKR